MRLFEEMKKGKHFTIEGTFSQGKIFRLVSQLGTKVFFLESRFDFFKDEEDFKSIGILEKNEECFFVAMSGVSKLHIEEIKFNSITLIK